MTPPPLPPVSLLGAASAAKSFFLGDRLKLAITIGLAVVLILFGASLRKHFVEIPKVAQLSQQLAEANERYDEREIEYANERLQAEAKYRAEVERISQSNVQLSQQLSQREVEIDEHKNRIRQLSRQLTVGRDCLSADAVRVLNNAGGAAALPASGQQAGSPERPAQDDAAGAATDTDIFEWVADAKAQYAQCVRRLSGWQQWYDGL